MIVISAKYTKTIDVAEIALISTYAISNVNILKMN
jgi:hypothetical protein